MRFLQILKNLQLKRQIKKITRLLFSDTFPIETQESQEIFIERNFSSGNKKKLLHTYLCIQFVTTGILFSKPYPPITAKEFKEFFDELEKLDKFLTNEKVFQAALNLHRFQAYRNLGLASYYFTRGREKIQTDYSSFGAKRYLKEKSLRRPLRINEFNILVELEKATATLDLENKFERKYVDEFHSLRTRKVIDRLRRNIVPSYPPRR